MTSFVQIIEFETDRIDDVRRLDDELREHGGEMRFTSGVVAHDRDNPNAYMMMVEFPSYEEAEANNEDPETQRFASRMSELVTKPMTYHNLDVVDRLP